MAAHRADKLMCQNERVTQILLRKHAFPLRQPIATFLLVEAHFLFADPSFLQARKQVMRHGNEVCLHGRDPIAPPGFGRHEFVFIHVVGLLDFPAQE